MMVLAPISLKLVSATVFFLQPLAGFAAPAGFGEGEGGPTGHTWSRERVVEVEAPAGFGEGERGPTGHTWSRERVVEVEDKLLAQLLQCSRSAPRSAPGLYASASQ